MFCGARTGLPVRRPSDARESHATGTGGTTTTTTTTIPAMSPGCTTVDYALVSSPGEIESSSGLSLVFVMVVDICVPTVGELEALKRHLVKVLGSLPYGAYVGLITYGTTVQIHQTRRSGAFQRCCTYRGTVEVSCEDIRRTLGVDPQSQVYLSPVAEAREALDVLFEELQPDLWPVEKGHRALRCTGAAISAATSLLQCFYPKTPARVLTFVSGICTEGPGRAVDVAKTNLIRGHADIRDQTAAAKHWPSSISFYASLMRRMVSHSYVLDVFSACLDQTGLAEMKTCIQCTGGTLLMVDGWQKPHFAKSLEQYFLKDDTTNRPKMFFNVSFEVQTTPNWKVMGAIGPCIGGVKKSSSIADTEMGMGGTAQWLSSTMAEDTTLAVYFEAHNSNGTNTTSSEPLKDYRFVQFVTKYVCVNGETRIRVSTLPHRIHHGTDFNALGQTFDQEAAAVLVARLCAHKTESSSMFDVLRWLDRHLIRFVHRFATFNKDDPRSLRLGPRLSFFPIFMYHLRRSPFLQFFNSSPDETANYRIQLFRTQLRDAILMIHPTLVSYTMTGPESPVPLDESAIQDENILVLDTFFEIVIQYGVTIQEWIKAGYEKNPDYAHFRAFLDRPRKHVQELLRGRQPAPVLYECSKFDPSSRILMNRINPSRSRTTKNQGAQLPNNVLYGKGSEELMWTDDVTLQTFTDHLKRVAVQNQ